MPSSRARAERRGGLKVGKDEIMEITHNNLNGAIQDMEVVVNKGQPFAKRNKERRIRAILREMKAEQTKPITLRDVWFYVKFWGAKKIKSYGRHQT